MKFTMKRNILTCLGLLGLAALPALAQNTLPGTAPSPSGAMLPPPIAPAPPSITAHLQMQPGQIGQLNRLYDDYASQRLKHEASIAQWQNQLRQAQASTPFDQNRATRLLREINEAQQKVAQDFLAARSKALKVLTPVQRSQLESLSTDARIRVLGDRYYQLLLMPVDGLWQLPLDNGLLPGSYYSERNPSDERARDSGSYGVYGGYGQPDYGVYGSYGQGGVGVQVGIGRGGPSIGVGIGSVFGGIFGRHRRY